MQNIAIILTLLVLPYWALLPTPLPEEVRGRIGVAFVLGFTGIGHFLRTSVMAAMLPPWIPMRVPLVQVTGVFELAVAIALFIPSMSRHAGLALCAFLVLVLPANIHAAYQRIDFGGHAAGPAYLLVRVPLQLLLLGWVYWHCVRPHAAAT